MDYTMKQYEESAQFIRSRLGDFVPRAAIDRKSTRLNSSHS